GVGIAMQLEAAVLAQPADAELEPERREGEGVMADARQIDDVVRLGGRARNPHLVAPVATAGDALGPVGVVARLLEGERHRPRGRGGLPETVLLHEGTRPRPAAPAAPRAARETAPSAACCSTPFPRVSR